MTERNHAATEPEAPPTRRPFSYRRMGRAALVVAAGVLLSRVLGLFRQIVFANALGANAGSDEYFVAFLIPDFLNYLLAGGYMAITFIPILSRYLADGDEEGGWRAFVAIARPVALVMTVLAGAAMLLAEPAIRLIEPGFTSDQVANAARLTRIVLPAQIFFIVGSLLMAVQYARERFLIPTLAPIIYNLGIIGGGLASGIGAGDPTADGFAWGVLGGAILGNFLIQWWGARRVGLRVPSATSWRHPAVREYLALAVPLMLGQSLVVLDEQLGRAFGSLGEGGGISWLNYGRRTMLVPVGVIGQAAGVAAYPFLARLVAEGKLKEMAAAVGRALRYVIVFSLIAAAGLIALAIPTIRLLYQHGNFDAADTVATAGTLAFFGLGVPLWGAQQILARGLYARREMWAPVLMGTAATVLAVPIYYLFYELDGIRGLALASTVSLAAYTAALATVWYRRTGWEHARVMIRTLLRALPLAAAAGAAAWGAARLATELVSSSTRLGSLAVLGAGGAALLAVVLLTYRLWGDLLADRPDQ